MYASLISAGVSQLYDLYKSATDKGGPATASSTSATPAPSGTSTGGTDAVNSTGTSGGGLSDAIHKLFTDLQSGSSSGSSTTDATSTVAGDLQSLFKQLKGSGAHGHHHPPGKDTATASANGSTTTAASPFQGLSASLLSYTKAQGLGAAASGSTSLTA